MVNWGIYENWVTVTNSHYSSAFNKLNSTFYSRIWKASQNHYLHQAPWASLWIKLIMKNQKQKLKCLLHSTLPQQEQSQWHCLRNSSLRNFTKWQSTEFLQSLSCISNPQASKEQLRQLFWFSQQSWSQLTWSWLTEAAVVYSRRIILHWEESCISVKEQTSVHQTYTRTKIQSTSILMAFLLYVH